MAINIESEEREDGTRTKRYDIDPNQCIFCGFAKRPARPMRLWKPMFVNTTGEKKRRRTIGRFLANGDK